MLLPELLRAVLGAPGFTPPMGAPTEVLAGARLPEVPVGGVTPYFAPPRQPDPFGDAKTLLMLPFL